VSTKLLKHDTSCENPPLERELGGEEVEKAQHQMADKTMDIT
jgi:hypothetical protein